MSLEKGGRADKLGNRYEGWWLVKQLLRILNEEVISLTLEPVGEDEKGVEFWLEYKDGKRQAHQCKARNAHKEGWSVNELKNKEVLKNIKYQLDRNLNYEFVFVSAVSNTLLGDICDSARNSKGDPEDFYNSQIFSRGKEVKKTFNEFCNSMALNYAQQQDRHLAYEYLKRIKIIFYPDHETTKQDLLREAGFLFTGSPETVFSCLITYAVENNKLGKPIIGNDLFSFFETQDIFPKQLAHDDRILPTVKSLQRDFVQSIEPLLIGSELIRRMETQKCLEILQQEGLLILTGDSGSGKSGILLEIINKLDEDGITYIPLRVDRRVPKNTAEQFGKELGLPDSPAFCLASISQEQTAVLIIDQLDAIRWTSNHSTNALDVCKELINQVLFFKRQGKDIKIIIACRSFDLEFDVELKNWFENSKKIDGFAWERIEVGMLPEDNLKNLIGESYVSLNVQQKKLLARPQNLFMWLEINVKERSTFVTSLDLIREFWDSKFLDIEEEGISVSEVMIILENLVDFMERKGVISAPGRIVYKNSRKALTALKSNSILREQGGTISFCHQSYLDFLIAQRVVDEIDKGSSILDWLGSKGNQTLLRREQLRQALNMVLMEGYFDFLNIVKEILFSEDVRFHLKHLVLEVIGHVQTDQLDSTMTELLLELVKDEEWKDYVLEIIFYNNKSNIKLLIERQVILDWLNSKKEENVNVALNLLYSVKEKLSEEIYKIIILLFDKGESWQRNILKIIGNDIITDSEDIFNIRLMIAEKRIYPQYINWGDIYSKYPFRTIKYIESILKSYNNGDELEEKNNQSRRERWYNSDLKGLINVSENNCIKTWDILMPQIIRLVEKSNEAEAEFDLRWVNYFEAYDITQVAVKLIISAGKKMAVTFPCELIERVNRLGSYLSNTVLFIICESYESLNPEYSDIGIEWFLNNSTRIIEYGGIDQSRHDLARRLIKSLSPYCNESSFRKLETHIMHYHSPNEFEIAKVSLKYRKNGYYPQYWGEVQYLLLSQLSPSRICLEVSELLSVLYRRYNGVSEEEIANKTKGSSGYVGSKLDRNLEKISDNAWLRIITNKSIPQEHGKIRELPSDKTLLETSIWQFASSLEKAAKNDPERFGRLALKFPEETNHCYITAVFRAFEITELNNNENPELDIRKPATAETIIKVLCRYSMEDNLQVAMAFCRLLRVRDDIEWPDEIINKLTYIAVNHPDPKMNSMNVYSTNWDKSMDSLSAKDLFENSINCVRGVAVEAIKTLIWKRPNLFIENEKVIEKIINDPHPSVRISTVGMLIPIINIDREKAVDLFIKNAYDDLRVICTSYGISFIKYTIQKNYDLLRSLIIKMADSKIIEVAKLGSEMIVKYHIIYNLFEQEYKELAKGNSPQRQGVVLGAISLINEKEHTSKCAEILRVFLDEYDSDIANEMRGLLHYELADLEEHIDLVVIYIKSPYFRDNNSYFIYELQNYKGSLLDFKDIIFTYCNEICDKYSSETRDFTSGFRLMATDLPPLLLRLYEESMKKGQKDVFILCLDIWDKFFLNRVGSARELTRIAQEN
ncbi:AAA family ATPase [Bacillus cereus]|uniref:AAA family ATPase n=1 Tax=Bacillus cereus TaxID=1396 RepID=UPI000C28FBB1|nr:AAA family ATPase [Bacillus cereus]